MKKNRDNENCFVVEGKKIVLELLENNSDLIELICTTEKGNSSTWYHVTTAEMKMLSSFSTPSTHLAVVKKPSLDTVTAKLTLVIDGVQDPGNMGTIIRTCDWFGVHTIVCSQKTVDCFNPKVVQSSMGSIFRVQVEYTDLNKYLENTSSEVYGAVMKGANVNEIKTLPANSILVVGNEGQGISSSLLKSITQTISIPGKGGAESLNVAVATGVLLAKFTDIIE